MSFKITDTDKGAKDRIKQFLRATKRVTVGIHGDVSGTYENGASVLEIASFHEFGVGVPRRSFLADWYDSKLPEIRVTIKSLAVQYARGKLSLEQALEQLGAWAVGSIQERISSNIPPPLADSTVKRKRSSVALIDTGVLRSSITYKVAS